MTAGIAPIPKMQMVTPDMVRASVRRARRNLEAAAEEIVWQVEMEAWRTLGYPSWGAMREAEYGGAAFMVPSKSRPELVERLRVKGLTQREIADTAGVSQPTVQRDLSEYANEYSEASVMNSRGQQRPASYQREVQSDDVIDAEIVDNNFAPDTTTGPAGTGPATTTCPTCNGSGKVTS